MKKHFIIFLLSISVTPLFGQITNQERIKTIKVAFMTERIDMTSKEAQQFWPVYNTFEDKMTEIHKEENKTFIFINENIDQMDEATAKKALAALETYEEGKIDAREKLLKELNDILSYKKTLIFIKAEGDFKRNLLRKLRGGRN